MIKIIFPCPFKTLQISEKDIKVGTIATNNDHIEKFINIGLKYIVYGVDCNIIKSSYENIVQKFRNKTSS